MEVKRGEDTVALLTVKEEAEKNKRIIALVAQMNGITDVNTMLNLAVYAPLTGKEKTVQKLAVPSPPETLNPSSTVSNPSIQLQMASRQEKFSALGLNSNLETSPQINSVGVALSAYLPKNQSITWLNWLGFTLNMGAIKSRPSILFAPWLCKLSKRN